MSDKSAQTKKKLAQNADKIAIAVLALIFAGLLYAWWQEQNNTLGKETPPMKPVALADEIAESPELEMLQQMSPQPQITNAPGVQRVASLNMFNFSTIEEERRIEAEAEAKLQQAQTLIQQGQTDQARTLLLDAQKVIAYRPDLKQALDQVTSKPEELGAAGTGEVAPAEPVM